MKDAEQVETVSIDPVERFQLFLRIHYESRRTLSLVADPNDFFHPVIFPGQQTACFERRGLVHETLHDLPMAAIENQFGNQWRKTAAPQAAAMTMPGVATARLSGMPSAILAESIVSA